MICTWKACPFAAEVEQRGKDGVLLAFLCKKHAEELDAAIDSLSPPLILSAWVKAHGGAKEMAKSLLKPRS